MPGSTAIDVDCSELMPECGLDCAKCIKEIRQVLTSMDGISMAHMECRGEEKRLIVEHDSTKLWVGQLTKILEKLPSFHKGRFKVRVVTL